MKRIVTVCSGKGGVGKTNVAINLALLFSKVQKTILFDFDLGLSNVGILLGLNVLKTLENVLKNNVELKDVIYKYKNLSILPGGHGITKLADMDDTERHTLLNKVKEVDNFDIGVIDTSPGISINTRQFTQISTDIVIVTKPTIDSITDCYLLLKTIYKCKNSISDKVNVGVVVNQVNNKIQAINSFNIIQSNSEKYLRKKINYLGFMNTHSAVTKAVNAQVPFTIKDNKSLSSIQLKNIFYNVYKKKYNKEEKKQIEHILEKEVFLNGNTK